jgi:hypothetical protein
VARRRSRATSANPNGRPRPSVDCGSAPRRGLADSNLRVPGNESWTMEPNSTSTGVGVLTSVLNLSLPFTGWMRNTAIFGVLVGGIKKISRRVDVHPAGPLAARRLPTDHFEFAAIRLDLEHCHAVMSAVRIVEEVPQSARSKSMAIRLMCGPLG